MAPCERKAAGHTEEGSAPAGTLERCPKLPGGPELAETECRDFAQLGSRPDVFALWVRVADLTSNFWACFLTLRVRMRDFSGTTVVKNLPCNAGDMGLIPGQGTKIPYAAGFPLWLRGEESTSNAGLIPGSGRSPRGGHGNPLQYSCLENPIDRGAWRATVHGVAKSRT